MCTICHALMQVFHCISKLQILECIPLDYHSQMCGAWIFVVGRLEPHTHVHLSHTHLMWSMFPGLPLTHYSSIIVNTNKDKSRAGLGTRLVHVLGGNQFPVHRMQGHHSNFAIQVCMYNCLVLFSPCPVGQGWLLLPGGTPPPPGGHRNWLVLVPSNHPAWWNEWEQVTTYNCTCMLLCSNDAYTSAFCSVVRLVFWLPGWWGSHWLHCGWVSWSSPHCLSWLLPRRLSPGSPEIRLTIL